jgi:hypothetical protein
LEGALIIALACLNSLIEVEDQSVFILQIFDSLIHNAVSIMDLIRKNSNEHIFAGDCKDLFKLSKRLFDLLELAISRMVDEEDLVEDKLDEIRKHSAFQMLLFSYLTCYSPRKSIISPLPHVNNVKEMGIEIIFALYRTKPMPLNLFHLFLITFLLES